MGDGSTMALDFLFMTNHKLWDGRLTRNVRNNYNAMQFDPLGRLVWAPANMCTTSELFSSGAWIYTGTASQSSSAILNPFGGQSFRITGATNLTFVGNNLWNSQTVVANMSYTFSVYIKSITATTVSVGLRDGISGIIVGSTQSLAGGGWFRVSVTAQMTSTTNSAIGMIGGADGDIAVSCAQFEPTGSDSPKAYAATTGAGYFGARLDYDPVTLAPIGLLVEEARPNAVKNSAGIGGSVGVWPTGWSCTTVNGISGSVVGVGTEDGMPYVDVQISGTATLAGAINVEFGASTDIAGATGQTWAGGFFARKVGGSAPSGSVAVQVVEGNPSYLSGALSSILTSWLGASLRLCRQSLTYTFANALTANARLMLALNYALTEAVNVTIRFGCPQLEGGSSYVNAYGATSPLLTFGAASTRAADIVTATTLSLGISAAAGTILAAARLGTMAAGGKPVLSMDDNTASNSNNIFISSGFSAQATEATAAVTVSSPTGAGTTALLTPLKVAESYDGTGRNVSMNGGGVGNDLTPAPASGLVTFRIGGASGVGQFNGWISSIKYYPRVVVGSALQTLST